jgi:8-oxo-dGTP pyrophosphatase MutT (NUDIX family)
MRAVPHLVVAAGFICDDNRLLIARRTPDKAVAPGLLHLPGGHLLAGEDTRQALEREIREEFGFDIQVGMSFGSFVYGKDTSNPTVGVVHFARPTHRVRSLRPTRDHSEAFWISEAKVDAYLAGQRDHNLKFARIGFRLLRSNVELFYESD